MNKLLLLLLVAAAAVCFVAFDLDRYLTLQALKDSQARLAAAQADAPWMVAAAYFLVYVLIAALSLPGAAVMTVAGGALFGTLAGTILVSFASSIGAALAFSLARYVLRDSVQRRFADRLKGLNGGLERDGAFYLFTLRLVPVVPFFIVNLTMGLTRIRLRTFYWVSQAGMLAGTIVYVNAGTQLAGIDRLADVASPQLLLSLTALGLFPLAARHLLRLVQRRRVYKRWRRPAAMDRNLIVIGAGAAGLVSAYIAAAVKARVTLIEAHRMGGDCLNYGCVPSKALIRTAKLAHQMRHAARYGLNSVEPHIDFKAAMARVQQVILSIEPHDSVERYTQLGVEVLIGRGRILDPWTVEVAFDDGSTRRLTTRSIVIATGAQPFVPSLPGLDAVGYVTSETLWNEFAKLERATPRLVVLGGGPIGCELAQCFARLGSTVALVETLPRLLSREDEDVARQAQYALEADGVTVLTGHNAVRAERRGTAKVLVLEHAGRERRIEFDALICAAGRSARLSGYGLEELGIRAGRVIETDEYLQTLYPNIYAAGDVAGPYQLTHAASHQAWYASVNALFGQFKRFKADYSVMPWTTFVDPEIARVGLNEQEARAQGIACEVTRFELCELDRAIADSATHGFVKVLTRPSSDRILGVTIVGEHAGDLLAEYVLAMKQRVGLKRILGTIHSYPTLAEANKYAAGEWRRAHVPERLLSWVAHYHAWRRS